MRLRGKQRPKADAAPRLNKNAAVTYCVRESNRAKHIRLKVSLQQGLEIVVPQGFDQRELPAILNRKQAWIERALRRADKQKAQRELLAPDGLPRSIALAALDETWSVAYRFREGLTPSLSELASNRLELRGDTDEASVRHALLGRWLRMKGEAALIPWLRQISHDLDLPYTTAIVRGQRTRWGSCSSRKTISLNYKLLFLPPHLVRYLFVHELCHTKHLNHSSKFWMLVAEKEPSYKVLEDKLNSAWQYVPLWVDS